MVIGNGETITFSKLLNTFYGKAAEKHYAFRPKLDFILKISNETDDIKTRFDSLVNGFVDSTKRDKVLQKVPEDMKIDGFNTRTFFQEGIDSIIDGQMKTIKNLTVDICSKIKFELDDKNDSHFVNSFQKLKILPADPKLMQRVRDNMNAMNTDYNKLHEKFNEEMKRTDELRKIFETNAASVNLLFDQLIRLSATNTEDFKRLAKDIESAIVKLYMQQPQLFDSLEKIQDILENYNRQRLVWIEFLLGKRISHKMNGSDVKKTLKPFTRNLKEDIKRPPWRA